MARVQLTIYYFQREIHAITIPSMYNPNRHFGSCIFYASWILSCYGFKKDYTYIIIDTDIVDLF